MEGLEYRAFFYSFNESSMVRFISNE